MEQLPTYSPLAPGFTRFEQRRRGKLLDQLITDTSEQLARPEVARQLGTRAQILGALCGTLTVPNCRNGKLVMPRGHEQRNEIGLWLMPNGEQAEVTLQYLMPIQREMVKSSMHAMRPGVSGVLEMLVDKIEEAPQSDLIHPDNTENGRCLYYAAMHEPTEIAIRSRPFIAINKQVFDDQPGYVPTETLVHELSHATEVVMQPATVLDRDPHDINLRTELRAYHDQAQYVVARGVDPGYLMYSTALRVEAARGLANGAADTHGAFEPTEAVKRNLANRGLETIYKY